MNKNSINIIYKNVAGSPVDNKEAVRLIKNYKDNGGWALGKTKSVYIDVDTLEAIVEEIKKIQTIDPSKIGSGVRIYVGRYKDSDIYPADKRGRRTLVFMPTFKNASDPINYDDITIEEVRSLKQEIINDADIFSITPFNHGELCPNNCNGANIVEGLT